MLGQYLNRSDTSNSPFCNKKLSSKIEIVNKYYIEPLQAQNYYYICTIPIEREKDIFMIVH